MAASSPWSLGCSPRRSTGSPLRRDSADFLPAARAAARFSGDVTRHRQQTYDTGSRSVSGHRFSTAGGTDNLPGPRLRVDRAPAGRAPRLCRALSSRGSRHRPRPRPRGPSLLLAHPSGAEIRLEEVRPPRRRREVERSVERGAIQKWREVDREAAGGRAASGDLTRLRWKVDDRSRGMPSVLVGRPARQERGRAGDESGRAEAMVPQEHRRCARGEEDKAHLSNAWVAGQKALDGARGDDRCLLRGISECPRGDRRKRDTA